MSIVVTDLRCERLSDPIGIGTATPRLSWRLEATAGETDVVQLGWQVRVEDHWDSGRTDGREQSVRYDGPPLGSRGRYAWRVRGFTSAGDTDWSEPASFEIGLLHPEDWRAAMITASATTPVARFSKAFEAGKVSRRACTSRSTAPSSRT
jgi:alpha-L-rhamnosidase